MQPTASHPLPTIIEEHWLAPVCRHPSPNCDARPQGSAIDLLVIHNISLPPNEFGGGFVEAFFCNQLDAHQHSYFASIATLKVSAHLLIDRAGKVTQFVPFDRRAWHAGVSSFAGRSACNDFSIGIELEGADHLPFSDDQYRSLIAVTRLLQRHYPAIREESILGHSDIAPGRKTDPGPAFDWQRYRTGLAKLSPHGSAN